jgi:deoxyribodipyrimidine photolyase-related protein
MIVLLGNMLFADHSALALQQPVFMAEDWQLCTCFKYHKHKLILYLAAMRHHCDRLRDQGLTVEYCQLSLETKTLTYEDKLLAAVKKFQATTIETYTIENREFSDRLERFCQTHGLELIIHDSPLFLTSHSEFQAYRSRYKRLFMGDFYKLQRQRLGVLLDPGQQPIGGKWSLDDQNRQALPKGITVPELPWPTPTNHVQAVSALVDRLFSDHPGASENFWLPVTHEAALSWLDDFLQHRLAQFGPYEDALPTRSAFVFHSVLSPLINIGLLTPAAVLQSTLTYAEEHPVSLNSLEGFVRQIIGWREYIRGVYWTIGDRQVQSNAFNHTRQLTNTWYDGSTGLLPLDFTIKRVQERGWAHHIERLMVISNAMLLAEVHPDQVYRWFMELFVDSADWVMVPNVYGMGQFADGGLMMTKPYVSGSNYLLKMGDFAKGDWCDIWDGLYWRFVDRKRDILAKNPRMNMTLNTFAKMNSDRKQKILAAAEQFIQEKTSQ